MYNQGFNPFAQNVAIVKDYFKQTSVLVLAIIQGLAVIFSAVSAFIVSASIVQLIKELMFAMRRAGVKMNGAEVRFSTGSPVSTVFSSLSGSVLMIATMVLFIILFAKCRNANPASSPYGPLNGLYIVSVIELVFVCIAMFFVLIVMIVFAVLIPVLISQGADSAEAAGGIVLLEIFNFLIFGGAIFLALFTSINQVRFFKSAKTSVSSLKLSAAGAKPFGVMNVIAAVCVAFGVLSTLMTLVMLGTLDKLVFDQTGVRISYLMPVLIVALVASVFEFLIYIFTAKIALGYAKHIRQVTTSLGEDAQPMAPGMVPPGESYQPPMGYMPIQDAPPENNGPGFISAATPAGICPSCGNPVKDDSVFCTGCGFKLK